MNYAEKGAMILESAWSDPHSECIFRPHPYKTLQEAVVAMQGDIEVVNDIFNWSVCSYVFRQNDIEISSEAFNYLHSGDWDEDDDLTEEEVEDQVDTLSSIFTEILRPKVINLDNFL